MGMKYPERYLLTVLIVLILLILLFITATLFFIFRGDGDLTNTLNQLYLILFVILAILLIALVSAAILFVVLLTKSSIQKGLGKAILELNAEDIKAMSDEERSDLLHELKNNKKRIEYLIKMAESKYHRRKLDEESFREIVRDQQKKLMEIEAKMNEIGDEINELKKGK